jgi:hypothetical protein
MVLDKALKIFPSPGTQGGVFVCRTIAKHFDSSSVKEFPEKAVLPLSD